MPDRYWGWGWYNCKDFRPETDAHGKIRKGGILACHDQDGAMTMENWQWSYDGKPKKPWLSKMYAPATEIIGDKIYLNQ